jgi:hypothetical protein
MYPQLIWQERESLLSLIATLGADDGSNLCRCNRSRRWRDQTRQHQQAAEDG